MEIFFSDIPEEGLPISGRLSPSFFDLTGDDSIRIPGKVEFNLTLYSFEGAVVLSGHVRGSVELQCVTCLEYFPHDADFPTWQSEYENEEGEVSFDPRESLRDEFILALPATPHCDEMMDNRECPKAGLLARFEHDETPLADEAKPSGDDVWGALDQLKKDS